MILLIDNYDSFVFNLDRYVRRLGQATEVVRNDAVNLSSIAEGKYSAIIVSPGPKAPDQAGRSLEVIERFHTTMPILGVCLGHQAICQSFGARIIRAHAPFTARAVASSTNQHRCLPTCRIHSMQPGIIH